MDEKKIVNVIIINKIKCSACVITLDKNILKYSNMYNHVTNAREKTKFMYNTVNSATHTHTRRITS